MIDAKSFNIAKYKDTRLSPKDDIRIARVVDLVGSGK
jgi:hypothetical protein